MRAKIPTLAAALAVAIASLANPAQAQARKGESTVGITAGYTTKNSAPTAGIFYQYSFSEHFTIAPALGCSFRNKGMDNFYADLNVHFPFAVAGKVTLYPLAGMSYVSWDHHSVIDADIDDVSTRVSRLGLNIGAGLAIQATRSLKVKIEATGTLNKNYSTFSPEIGIGYTF